MAATRGPGLPSALMVGLKAAQAMAFVLRRPFLGIHHHEAHLYSPWINGQPPVADFSKFQPNVSLIVSGGHTLLVHVRAELDHHLLGSTVDDAAGECFDKTGKLIGLPYPAGPEIDRLAEGGNPKAFDFPRPMIDDPNDDFSFSGLKTSVRYFLRDHPGLLDDAQRVRDLCASVQAAIVDVLVTKTIRAARRLGVGCVTASGGVTCNRALRQRAHRRLRARAAHPAAGRARPLHRQRRDDRHSGRAQAGAPAGVNRSRRGHPPQLGAGESHASADSDGTHRNSSVAAHSHNRDVGATRSESWPLRCTRSMRRERCLGHSRC